ncbi:MAG: sulfite exporter TauE/SafE family protein [Chloroflexi bacterium]|nr:sulfite exporter TauE/SafE family protein [Chloroflexota bacterium]
MTPALWLVVAGLSFGGGVVTGLLGGGGALVMVPLLLYGPPLLDVGVLPVKTVAAIVIVYGVCATASGIVAYYRRRQVSLTVAGAAGGLIAGGALLGGVLSKWTPDALLLAAFATMATLGAVLMLPSGGPSHAPSGGYRLRRPWVLGLFFPEGVLAGMVGVGGGFLTVPVLHVFMAVPLRMAIGSSLAVSWFGLSAGLAGKLVTGQVPFWLSLAAAIGGVGGAQLGVLVNRRIRAAYLRHMLVGLLVVVAVRFWWETLSRAGVL